MTAPAEGPALRVALLGCGTVGAEVVRLLHTSGDDLTARVGAPLELAGIAVRRINRARDLPVDPDLFTTDAAALVARDDVDLVVEVIGGIEPARSHILSALRSGRRSCSSSARTAGPASSRPDSPEASVREPLQHSQSRLQVLFLVALFGVLFAVGVAVAELAGTWASLAYSVVAVGLLVVGAARARAAQERGRRAAGRTCTCCTATQHDPVKVI